MDHVRDGYRKLAELLAETGSFGTVDEFWQAVQDDIRERLGHRGSGLCFRQTEPMALNDGHLVIGTPNVVIQQYLTQKYRKVVEAAVESLLGRPLAVSFDIAPRLFRQMRARQDELQAELAKDEVPAQAPARARGDGAAETELGFDRLIVTRSNRLPFAAARELAGQERPRFRFIYISGDYGQGKSVLLRAMYALAAGPETGLRPVMISAEDWCNEYYHAIQHRRTRSFRSNYRSYDLFLLDDVQFVEGKSAGQDELLHTVKHVLANGGRVALAGKPRREELADLGPALRALLHRALPAALAPPLPEERLDLAGALSARRGLKATPEALMHIADTCGDSFGRMESAINCLAMYARVHGRETVGLPEALETLSPPGVGAVRRVSLADIRRVAAEVLGVSVEQVSGRSRSRTVLLCRHIAMYCARKLTGASLSEIGRFFGRSSHSSVKHAVAKIEAARSTDPALSDLIAQIERMLGGGNT
jgi:chromosomal replication initiator protein